MAALLLGGIHIAERCCVVALAILADGAKLPVGLWEGSTEHATVVRHLLADLQGQGRGLDPSRGLLVVIDGARALASAVRSVFGKLALIQRCTVHYAEWPVMWMRAADGLSEADFVRAAQTRRPRALPLLPAARAAHPR